MEGISRVKDAVSDANNLVAQAQKDADDKLKAKVQELDDWYSSEKASFQDQGQAMVDKARQEAQQEAEKTLAEGEDRTKQIISMSGAGLERAASTIVERIVNMNGNS